MLSGMTQLTFYPGRKPDTGRRSQTRAKTSQLRRPGFSDAGSYNRARDLPALLALWPSELMDFTQAGTGKIISRLQRALRAERARGMSGHWAYDLQRHIALVRAYKAECCFLSEKTIRKNSANGTV